MTARRSEARLHTAPAAALTEAMALFRDVHAEPPPLDIDAFAALEQAATPGWWRAGAHDRDRVFCHYTEAMEGPMGERVLVRLNEHFPRVEIDAAFIAASRAWVGPLIQLAREARPRSARAALEKAIRVITVDLPAALVAEGPQPPKWWTDDRRRAAEKMERAGLLDGWWGMTEAGRAWAAEALKNRGGAG